MFCQQWSGVRGDMKAIIKAILLDPEAKSCNNGENDAYGSLREPFFRYVQINKAFDASTLSGNYRNDMDYVYRYVQQKLSPRQVYLIFPTGIPTHWSHRTGWSGSTWISDHQCSDHHGLHQQSLSFPFVIQENVADEYDLYTNEDDATYANEISTIDLNDEYCLPTTTNYIFY